MSSDKKGASGADECVSVDLADVFLRKSIGFEQLEYAQTRYMATLKFAPDEQSWPYIPLGSEIVLCVVGKEVLKGVVQSAHYTTAGDVTDKDWFHAGYYTRKEIDHVKSECGLSDDRPVVFVTCDPSKHFIEKLDENQKPVKRFTNVNYSPKNVLNG
jgi:hypothetical protein